MKSLRFLSMKEIQTKHFLPVLLLFFLTPLLTFGQNTVSGTIISSEGESLPGANILIKQTTTGTVSDADGNYQLEVPEDAVLTFSYIGYLTQEINVEGRSTINVSMQLDEAQLEEVVVVGYGTQRRSDLTGAVGIVPMEDIRDLANPNILDQIQGRVAGLTVVNTDFEPGGNPSILVRGKNSITASNEPLIILDGIPYEGSISAINPYDIESFNVLKDGSAAAIYGSRGANGVILITTKKGRSGKPTINYNGSVGFNSSISRIDVLGANQYVQLRDLIGQIHPSEQANLDAGKITDWQDEATRTALQHDNSVSISGATDDLNYYLTGGHLYQEGILVGSEFRRTTFRFNGSYDIRDWLEIGTNTQLTHEDWGDQGDVSLPASLRFSPLATPYNEDGTTTFYPIPEDPFFTNPLDFVNTRDARIRRGLITNLYADLKFGQIWEPLEGLSYRFKYGRSEQKENRDIYRASTTVSGFPTGGFAQRNSFLIINSTAENILNYDRQFNDHRIGITGLYSWQNRTSDATNVSGSRFVNDNLEEFGIGTGGLLSVTTPFTEWTLISQMGRLNYSYNYKYYFTFTVRRDGYSGFGTNDKWGIFPSVALGWSISQEGFMQGIEWVDNLKLRVSYGENGNQAIPPYRSLTQVTGGESRAYYFDNTALGFAPTTLGNPDLGWETTTTLNFGLDYSLAGDRIFGNIEYYNSKSDGLLLNRLLNSTQGFTSILQNIGETENNGVELLVGGRIFDRPGTGFNWEASVNFFKNNNKIVQLFDKQTDDLLNGWFIGEDIDANYNYIGDGVYGTQEQIDASHQPTSSLGDRILRDVNQNGELDDGDRAIQGSTSPDYTIGITNTLSYNNFTLSFFIYSVQGVLAASGPLDPRSWIASRNNYFDQD